MPTFHDGPKDNYWYEFHHNKESEFLSKFLPECRIESKPKPKPETEIVTAPELACKRLRRRYGFSLSLSLSVFLGLYTIGAVPVSDPGGTTEQVSALKSVSSSFYSVDLDPVSDPVPIYLNLDSYLWDFSAK